MSRTIPWRGKCPPLVSRRIAEMSAMNLLVVQYNGPTSFVLKDPSLNSGKKFKVTIGDVHQCHCGTTDDLCHHILFVLCKVFRLPHENPLVWQKSFLQSEIEKVIEARTRHMFQNVSQQNRLTASNLAGLTEEQWQKKMVDRRSIQVGDDTCPICCDELAMDRQLVFCRFGCGNNIHAACFKQYALHNASGGGPLLCPLCRGQWGPYLDEAVSHNVGCAECKNSINGERYQCALCVCYNLCSNCFFNPSIHSDHPFDVCLRPGMPFQPVTRPSAPTVTTATVDPFLDTNPVAPPPREAVTLPSVLLQEEVDALPRVLYDGVALVHDCGICQSEFQVGDTLLQMTTACRHYFHEPCLSMWLMEEEACCPIDRQSIRQMQREEERARQIDEATRTNNNTTSANRPQRSRRNNSHQDENVPPVRRPNRRSNSSTVKRKNSSPPPPPLSLEISGSSVSLAPLTTQPPQQRRAASINSAPSVRPNGTIVGSKMVRPPVPRPRQTVNMATDGPQPSSQDLQLLIVGNPNAGTDMQGSRASFPSLFPPRPRVGALHQGLSGSHRAAVTPASSVPQFQFTFN